MYANYNVLPGEMFVVVYKQISTHSLFALRTFVPTKFHVYTSFRLEEEDDDEDEQNPCI